MKLTVLCTDTYIQDGKKNWTKGRSYNAFKTEQGYLVETNFSCNMYSGVTDITCKSYKPYYVTVTQADFEKHFEINEKRHEMHGIPMSFEEYFNREVLCVKSYTESGTEYWTEGKVYKAHRLAEKYADNVEIEWDIRTNQELTEYIGSSYALEDFHEYFEEKVQENHKKLKFDTTIYVNADYLMRVALSADSLNLRDKIRDELMRNPENFEWQVQDDLFEIADEMGIEEETENIFRGIDVIELMNFITISDDCYFNYDETAETNMKSIAIEVPCEFDVTQFLDIVKEVYDEDKDKDTEEMELD